MSRSSVTVPPSSGKDWTYYVAAFWLYGLVFGTPAVLAFDLPKGVVKVYVFCILWPFIALLAFGFVGVVLGMLGCK